VLPDSCEKDEISKNLGSLVQRMDERSRETKEYLELLHELGPILNGGMHTILVIVQSTQVCNCYDCLVLVPMLEQKHYRIGNIPRSDLVHIL
jgi:hypothetical protein